MSSQRLNLAAQARDLHEEVEIPRTALPSRAAVSEEQGREGQVAPARAVAVTGAAVVRTLEELAGPDRIELLPLSVRVPRPVRETLDRRYHALRGKGKRIKLEDIVTAALRKYLGMEEE